MTNHTYVSVKISDILVPENRARTLDQNWAQALAAMFIDHGNKTAIEVRKAVTLSDVSHGHNSSIVDAGADAESYVLVSGLHRLEAAKIAGWDTLTVKVIAAKSETAAAEFKLHEVMENIGRRELTILDRAQHLYEFDRVMKELHPALRHGGDRKSDEVQQNQDAVFALRLDVATQVGLSPRRIQEAVKLWKSLSGNPRAAGWPLVGGSSSGIDGFGGSSTQATG
ncbi:MAG: ParB N-terminal domain-containing protein [Ahrensia sp.]|nr:ParB N-terminal domain-containing protein [Ahrensia sp.]